MNIGPFGGPWNRSEVRCAAAHLMLMSPTHTSNSPAVSDLDRLLTIDELSDYLGIPVGTLRDWRVDGIGPKAVKLGRAVRYPSACVRSWLEEQLDG